MAKVDELADGTAEVIPFGLTARQKRFAEEYFRLGNGTQAILEAGYDAKPESAKVMACQMLRDHRIKAYLGILAGEAAEREGTKVASLDDALARLTWEMKHAKSDTARVQAAMGIIRRYGGFLDRYEDATQRPAMDDGQMFARLAEMFGSDLAVQMAARLGLPLPDDTEDGDDDAA